MGGYFIVLIADVAFQRVQLMITRLVYIILGFRRRAGGENDVQVRPIGHLKIPQPQQVRAIRPPVDSCFPTSPVEPVGILEGSLTQDQGGC